MAPPSPAPRRAARTCDGTSAGTERSSPDPPRARCRSRREPAIWWYDGCTCYTGDASPAARSPRRQSSASWRSRRDRSGCGHPSLQLCFLPRSFLLSGRSLEGYLTLYGLQARDVLAHLLELIGLGSLPGGALHAQSELLLAHLQQLIRQLGGRLGPQLFGVH